MGSFDHKRNKNISWLQYDEPRGEVLPLSHGTKAVIQFNWLLLDKTLNTTNANRFSFNVITEKLTDFDLEHIKSAIFMRQLYKKPKQIFKHGLFVFILSVEHGDIMPLIKT